MADISKKILEYKEKNKLSSEDCAKNLGLNVEDIEKLENEKKLSLSSSEQKRIIDIIDNKQVSKSKKIIRVLDLIFRFVAMVMALVTLILCINENVDTKVLVVLLSIGLVCSSMTILPKIEK